MEEKMLTLKQESEILRTLQQPTNYPLFARF
jgi:hypothetical protein